MTRVHHVKKAAKDNAAVKKGEPYYWWAFRFGGGKHYSATYPRSSQTTQSEFWGQIYGFQEDVEDCTDADDLESLRDAQVGDLDDMAGEQADKKSGMPDALQDGPTGDLLEERQQACEEAAQELQDIEFEPQEGDDEADRVGRIREEMGEALDLDCQ